MKTRYLWKYSWTLGRTENSWGFNDEPEVSTHFLPAKHFLFFKNKLVNKTFKTCKIYYNIILKQKFVWEITIVLWQLHAVWIQYMKELNSFPWLYFPTQICIENWTEFNVLGKLYFLFQWYGILHDKILL